MLAAGGIILVLALLVGVRVLMPSSGSAPVPDAPAPDALVAQVTSVPASTLEQIGRGSASTLPTPVRAGVERGPDGKSLVTYIGAEYCPFCAGERWALIAALGRFGTFSGLRLSHSASDDVYPNTPTFSFVGTTYSSQYVGLSAVELQTNVRSGGAYQRLQTPTPAQSRVVQTYDAAPYVPAQSAGAIPFIDFAGQYVVPGASFDIGVLRGLSHDQIASALSDPSTPQARAILGASNALTAAICAGTGDSPAEVCGQPAVQSLEASLAAQPVPSRG
jgi:Domain of unknown function (DUF929)